MTRITNLRQLERLAKAKKAVARSREYHRQPFPAAIAFNSPGSTILRWMREGLYVYNNSFKKWRDM